MSRNSDGLQVFRTQVRFLHSVSCSVETHDLSVVKVAEHSFGSL